LQAEHRQQTKTTSGRRHSRSKSLSATAMSFFSNVMSSARAQGEEELASRAMLEGCALARGGL
jgi:hypothetical protein